MSLDVHPLLDELQHARQGNEPNATTMTFVVYFDEPAIAPWIRERMRLIIDKHPSRVVMLDGSQGSDAAHIDAEVPRGEWIEVGVRGANGTELAGALSQLSLPEAPVVLAWIASRIADDDRFATLAPRVQTVICNSSVLETGHNSQRDLIRFVEAHPEIRVQDLAYLRLSGWQDLIADFFDKREAMNELFQLRSVEIAAGSEAEAYYLLGWLASRLEWKPCGRNEMCNRDEAIVSFKIEREGPPRRLQRVVLRSEHTTFSAEVFDEDPNAVCLQATGAASQERRCAPVFGLEIASLVERAILQNVPDEVFLETAEMTRQIVDHQAQ